MTTTSGNTTPATDNTLEEINEVEAERDQELSKCELKFFNTKEELAQILLLNLRIIRLQDDSYTSTLPLIEVFFYESYLEKLQQYKVVLNNPSPLNDQFSEEIDRQIDQEETWLKNKIDTYTSLSTCSSTRFSKRVRSDSYSSDLSEQISASSSEKENSTANIPHKNKR